MAFTFRCLVALLILVSIESRSFGLTGSVVEMSSKKLSESSKLDGQGSQFWPPWPFSALSEHFEEKEDNNGDTDINKDTIKSPSPGLILINAMRSSAAEAIGR
jgi:hypothetical protein